MIKKPGIITAKNIIPNDRELRKGDWKYAFGGLNPNIEIRNKTCLILGLGSIGSEIAKRLRAFDVKLFAATRSGRSKHTDLVEKLVKIDEVKPLVEESDFIILSLPLTSDSKGLVNENFITSRGLADINPASSSNPAVKLDIIAINGGAAVYENQPFTVTVQSQDVDGIPSSVTSNINVSP